MAFTSKFFSISGQKERLSNVGKYAQLAVSKITGGVIPAPKNTDANYKSNSTIGKIADSIVNNPKTAALVVTGAAYATKAVTKAVQNNAGTVSASGLKAKAAKLLRKENKPGLITPVSTSPPGLIKPAAASSTPMAPSGGVITPSSPSMRSSSTPRKVRKTRKASKKRKTKRVKRSTKRKSKKRRIGTAKQYARKGGKSVKYTKNGQPYIILSDGRARFVKGKRK